MNEWLFSYGTLQEERVQLNLFGRLLKGSTDTLMGYKIAPIEITDETFLASGEGKWQQTAVITNYVNDSIAGMVFEVTPEELLHADTYEPVNYQRIVVKLASGKKAWIYTARMS